MSDSPPDASSPMSLPARLLCTIGLPLSFAGLAYHSPPTAALVPVLLAPTILAAWQYRRLPKEESGSAEIAIWTYLGTGTLAPIAAGILQLSLISVLFRVLFGARHEAYMRELMRVTLQDVPADIIDARKQMAWTPEYIAAIAIFSYVGAALAEEGLKYVALRLAVRRARPKHEREYLIYAAMAGLGYAAIENILSIHGSVKKGETTGMLVLFLFERVVVGNIGHTIMALLTGLQSIRRDARGEKLTIWRVLARAVVYHGTWNFALFSLSAWYGNVGWIHPTDVTGLVLGFSPIIALQGWAIWDVVTQLKQLGLRPCKRD